MIKQKLGDIIPKIRAKNAGPFWLTIDLFCGNQENYKLVSQQLNNQTIADLFHISKDQLQRFDMEELSVIKISFPRPVIQGDSKDRDMHGAAWSLLLHNIEINN